MRLERLILWLILALFLGASACTRLNHSSTTGPDSRLLIANQTLSHSPAENSFNPFILQVGQSISYRSLTLLMQRDGNLVLYQFWGKPNQVALWSTDTYGQCGGACSAFFQADGNLVLYHPSAYWQSGSSNHPGATLRLLEKYPYIEIVDGNTVVWSAHSQPFGPVTLNQGEMIDFNSVRLLMQDDGNLVLYQYYNTPNQTALWNSGTEGQCGTSCKAAFQQDGNLVLYHPSAYWQSQTAKHSRAQLILSETYPFIEIVEGPTVLWSGYRQGTCAYVPGASPTDTTLALQSCLDLTPTGSTVFLPAQTFILGSALEIDRPLLIETEGLLPSSLPCFVTDPNRGYVPTSSQCAVLKTSNNYHFDVLNSTYPHGLLWVHNTNNVTVDHLILDGNYDGLAGSYGGSAQQSPYSFIVRDSHGHITDQGICRQNATLCGVGGVESCTNCAFTNGGIQNVLGDWSYTVSASDGFNFSNNLCRDIGRAFATDTYNNPVINGPQNYGMQFPLLISGGLVLQDHTYGLKVQYNTFIDNTDGSISFNGYAASGSVKNNWFLQTYNHNVSAIAAATQPIPGSTPANHCANGGLPAAGAEGTVCMAGLYQNLRIESNVFNGNFNKATAGVPDSQVTLPNGVSIPVATDDPYRFDFGIYLGSAQWDLLRPPASGGIFINNNFSWMNSAITLCHAGALGAVTTIQGNSFNFSNTSGTFYPGHRVWGATVYPSQTKDISWNAANTPSSLVNVQGNQFSSGITASFCFEP